jgi:hypothetical protein
MGFGDPAGLFPGLHSVLHVLGSAASDVAIVGGAVAVTSALVLTAPVSVPVAVTAAVVGSSAAILAVGGAVTETAANCANWATGGGSQRDCAVGAASTVSQLVAGPVLDAVWPEIEEAGLYAGASLDTFVRGVSAARGRGAAASSSC